MESESHNATDANVVDSVLAGDRSAYALLVQRYEKSVRGIVSHTSSKNGDFLLSLHSDGRVMLHLSNETGGITDDEHISKTKLPRNKWSHVAATFHRGRVMLYVNGRVDAKFRSKIERTNRREYAHDLVTIGGLWSHQYTFNGMIDEVTIHCRPLSTTDVRTLFESGGVIVPDQAQATALMSR